MTALAMALVLLFELAIQVTRVHDRRAARKRAVDGSDEWDPDEPSPIDTTPSALPEPASSTALGRSHHLAGPDKAEAPVD